MSLKVSTIPVTPFQQNCRLIWNDETKEGVVIDPGGDLPLIRNALAKSGADIERILLTHGHIDHAAAATELAEELGVPIEGPHLADRAMLERMVQQGASYGIAARPVAPNRWLAEGDEVEIGGTKFGVLHCPGHSPGSVVFVAPSFKLAIVGDVLFRGSVGRTDLPGGDHAALIAAIKTKLLPLGDDVTFLCGHGPSGTLGEERRTNPYLV
jgi:glyoxylase-like metal-dependent hydrolase (beta-lactamase superfamily II)